MADISEVFLQAAQVIGQNIKFQQQNVQEQARLQLEKQKLDELAIYREQSLQAREDELKARQEKWATDQQRQQDELAVKQRNAATFETNSQISQQRANIAQYDSETKRMMAENKVTMQKRDKAINDFEQSVFASPQTGNPELDKTGYISMTIKQLQAEFSHLDSIKAGGRLDALEEQMMAKEFPGYQTTSERATAAQRQIMGVLQNRQQRLAQYRKAHGLDDQTKTVLNQFNYMQEGTSPVAGIGAIDQQLQDQSRANQTPGDRAAGPGAAPGTVAIGGGSTPETQAALAQIDMFSPEMLTNPKNMDAAASTIAGLLKARTQAKDGAGVSAIATKTNNKSQDLMKRVLDLLRSTK